MNPTSALLEVQPNMEKILEVKNLQYKYGAIKALNGISLNVGQGEIVAIIGANGAGKTTTLRCISGLNRGVSKGTIFFEGKDVSGIGAHKIARLGVAQCIEGRHIFSQLSVKDNLMMGAYLHKKGNPVIEEYLEYSFELFPILKERINQMGSTLSGGEQQMLAISRALMAAPKMLLLDEPSLGLAPKIIEQIFDAIDRINKERGIATLLIEQNVNLSLKIASRGYVLETGNIILEDVAENLLNNDMVKNSYMGIEAI